MSSAAASAATGHRTTDPGPATSSQERPATAPAHHPGASRPSPGASTQSLLEPAPVTPGRGAPKPTAGASSQSTTAHSSTGLTPPAATRRPDPGTTQGRAEPGGTVHTATHLTPAAPHRTRDDEQVAPDPALAAMNRAVADRATEEHQDEKRHDQDPATPKSAEDLKAEIERTRAEMGETAAALAAKLDVPARMRQSAAETGSHMAESAAEAAGRATARVGSVPQRLAEDPKRYALIGAALAAAAAGVALIRRSR